MKDSRVHEVIDWFCAKYQKTKGVPYIWRKGADSMAVKRALAYFDRLDTGGCALSALKGACGTYLLTDTKFARSRGWPFVDFGNNPTPFIEEAPQGEAEQDWETLLLFIKQKGRYSRERAPLSDKGFKALQSIGGRNAVCNARAYELRQLKEQFFMEHFVDEVEPETTFTETAQKSLLF